MASKELKPIPRVCVPDLDAILGRVWVVLDDGFIRVIDYLGSDQAIVQAARVSYGVGTKTVHEDRGLIRYLMRHQHTTPFEMCEIKLHLRAPMDVWRQWIRHRTANVNEYSTRYSIAIDASSKTHATEWRLQSEKDKQGSEGFLPEDVGESLSKEEAKLQHLARVVYEERLQKGVAREQARKDLPLSTYTEAYWKIDLHNLLHFLLLRMDSRAQAEIRAYANIIGNEIVARWCPIAWQAFKDYRLNSMILSVQESEILRSLALNDIDGAILLAEGYGWLKKANGILIPSRERREAEQKLQRLGIRIPWLVEQ